MNLPPDLYEESTERKTHRRFKVRKGVYAALNDGSYKLGQIQDISQGGFAFKYIADDKKTGGSFTVDIFANDHIFFLKNIPFRAISDIHEDYEIPFGSTSFRQCGGQFSELTPSQMSQLDYFIENYTTPED